jgi:hypothetical protein
MYCDDSAKLSLIFASLAERMNEKASTIGQMRKARQRAVEFDSPVASMYKVLGLDKSEQYHSRLTKSEWEAVTKHCQWDEEYCAWTKKLNENIEDEIKDSVLRNKLMGYDK